MIHQSPHHQFVSNSHQMYPKELAGLCMRRWITSDHMTYFVEQFNIKSRGVRTMLLNTVILPQKEIRKIKRNRIDVIVFVLNVFSGSKKASYRQNGGNHWSFAVFEQANKTMTYYDSLANPFPLGISKALEVYTVPIFGIWMKEVTIRLSHMGTGPGHTCNKICTLPNYPIQSDSDSCGPIVIIFVAIFTQSSKIFHDLLINTRKNKQNCLHYPSTYRTYIRKV